MKHKIKDTATESILISGIGLAAFYWICESFMYFFLEPEANIFQIILGPDLFQTWTRVLVLCIFAIFGSHVQYTYNKRREADIALRESSEKYRTILESIEEGYFETDLKGNLTFSNDPYCKILGYPHQQLLGKSIREYTSSDTAEKISHIMERVKQTGRSEDGIEYDVICKNGIPASLELSMSLLIGTDGKPAGYRGMLRDVTKRKETEEEKRLLETRLQQAQKMESIGTLAGGIAHDFNNILMGIQGNATLMQLKIDAAKPAYDKIKNIEKFVQNGTELTKQLLGFARRGKYLVKTTDLNEVIKRSSSLFARTKKEIQIHTNFHDEIWAVEVDSGQIEQALLNLYVNAWQAMPEGGDLYLKTLNVELDNSCVKPFKVEPGKYVEISVSDTGVGIDKETRERIFEPFFTTKEMGRGTGLGLASVYGIVKSHRGYIDVNSEKAKGTTFTIYLPASEKTAVIQETTPVETLKGAGTILLIDDEKMILDVGCELLEELGYTVLPALSGKQALEIFQKNSNKIDLVIMDMIMPGMGGGETFDHLRSIDPDIKVLLSSGYSVDGQATKILHRGCNGFIQKPFNLNQLAEKIGAIMEMQ
jgi:two-component system, cell cycle sensor histidine kinase and response regulator CckA